MSHSRPAQTTETKALATVIGKKEATMDVVVTSSVATVLLEFKAEYWSKNPSKEKMEQEYQDCLAALRDIPKNFPAFAEYKEDIEFIIGKAEEPPQDLDHVSLYFPGHGQKDVFLPLRQVLPLVLEATLDSEKYRHHYQAKESKGLEVETEKFLAAEEQLPMRLLTLLNRCRAIKQGICHHGVRNELVLTLNLTYQGVDILEDARTSISYFLKSKINDHFWKALKAAGESEQKDRLMTALFTWINHNHPRDVIALIDPQDSFRQELHQLFIEHHIDPKFIQLDQLIDQALASLEFECDTSEEHSVLRMMNRIMSASTFDEESPAGKALLAAQEWLRNNSQQWKDKSFQTAVTTFYSFHFTDQDLNKNRVLLALAGEEKESESVNDMIQAYFKEWETKKAPPSVSQANKQALQSLTSKLSQHKKEKMEPEIASFFALWKSARSENNQDSLRKRYNLLLNENFQSKVLFTETEIQTLNSALEQAQASGGTVALSSYEVNRGLLQAFIKKPQDWSLDFAKAFQNVLLFVKNLPAESEESESLNPSALKSGSYPQELLDQLDYRFAIYLNRQENGPALPAERPANWLLPLPGEINTAQEWLEIWALIDAPQRDQRYRNNVGLLQHLAKRSLEQNPDFNLFKNLVKTVPKYYLGSFFKALGPELLTPLLKRWEYRRIIFADANVSAYLEALGPNYLKSLITSPALLWEWERNLPADAIPTLLDTVGVEHINSLIKNEKDWTFIFERLTPAFQNKLREVSDKALLESKPIAQKIAEIAPQGPQHTLFTPATPKNSLAQHYEIHRFLQHVVLGEQEQAEALVKANPQLLLEKAEVTDYSGRRIIQTAYQLAHGADDALMAKMLAPYFEKIFPDDPQASLLVKAAQEQELYSEGPFEEKDREERDLVALKEVIAAIDASQNDEEGALQKFRDYLKPKEEPIRKGKHFNVQLLIEAFKLYDDYNAYNKRGGYNSRQNNLIWRKVIGYIQRSLPAAYAQAFCQGLYEIVDEGEALRRRSLEFRLDPGYFFFPLSSASTGLGVEYALADRPWQIAVACRALLDGAAARFFKELCQANTSELGKLMQPWAGEQPRLQPLR